MPAASRLFWAVLDSHLAFPRPSSGAPNTPPLTTAPSCRILGDKSDALGRSFADIWAEVCGTIGPIADRADRGDPTYIEDFALVINRTGASRNRTCSPSATVALSMMLTELATSATKYRALSSRNVQVTIGWSCDHDELVFDWRETGGPPAEPQRQGFGSRLIEMRLGHAGKMSRSFGAEGLAVNMRTLLAELSH